MSPTRCSSCATVDAGVWISLTACRAIALAGPTLPDEVQTGFQDPNNLQKAREMLDRFHLIVIDAAIADLAAELRREHRWKLPIALQAAAAKMNALFLVTRNVKDFPPERYEFVQIPYEI